MDTEQLILTEVRDIRRSQGDMVKEMGTFNTRLAVVETGMEQISARLGDTKQAANGTADFTDDLDGRVEVLETWCNSFKSRASKLAWSLLAFALAQAGTWIAWFAMGRRK